MSVDAKLSPRVVLASVAFALLLRVSFSVFLAQAFWGRPDPRIDGDTRVFFRMAANLLERGSLTCNPGSEYGYFCRMPGYPLLLAAAAATVEGDEHLTYRFVSWLQVGLDSLATALVLGIAWKATGNQRLALIAALLYAAYPFIVAWTPVVMSEVVAVDLLLLAAYAFVVRPRGLLAPAIAGVALAGSALCRPQILLFAPIAALAYLLGPGALRARTSRTCVFSVAFGIVFGLWPSRNLILHDRLLMTQDLRGWPTPVWADDTLAFLRYIYSVKEDWQPQFGQILKGGRVDWPPASKVFPGDAERLDQAVKMARTCGSGFSRWPGFAGQVVVGQNCDSQIASSFAELRDRQVALNPWHFWVRVPTSNLKKALFKSAFHDQGNPARRLAALLFHYRSALLLAGVAGAMLALRRRDDPHGLMFLCLAGFVGLYAVLCFGTGPQMRNIEMRYLLPADVLLLFPAAYLLESLRGLRGR
ncbi:MAG: hypothetical protein AB7O37_02530 [Vicinamibacteria bacterium]